jgi:hypothetical protein
MPVPALSTNIGATWGTWNVGCAGDVIGPAGQGVAAMEFDELLRAMRAGRTYVNVHSDKHPGGEIRGKLSHR